MPFIKPKGLLLCALKSTINPKPGESSSHTPTIRIHFNTAFPSIPGFFKLLFPTSFQPKLCIHLSPCYAWHVPYPSYPFQFDGLNNIKKEYKLQISNNAGFLELYSFLSQIQLISSATYSRIPSIYILPSSERQGFTPIKGKVVPVLYLIKHYTMKVQ
jgi:hypothetical protein